MSGAGFSTRTARWLAAAAALSLFASGFLAVFGGEIFEVPSVSADGFSRSAIGHHAFLELLRGLGFQVIRSRHATAAQGGGAAVVVLAEPDVGYATSRAEALEKILARAKRVLLVLPKRGGLPAELNQRWIGESRLVPASDAEKVLAAVVEGGHVVRPASTIGRWSGPLPGAALDDLQIFTAPGLEPLVASDAGMLAGERRSGDRHLIVLADPDVLATHGLGRAENAVLAVRLLERLGAGTRPVVVDETLHGHELQPSIARELFRFPLVLATFQAILVMALLAWAASQRFGRARGAPPPLGAGKAFLVDSSAALLGHGGHVGEALQAYWRAAQEELGHVLRPPGERSEGLERWLRHLAAARGRAEALAELERRVAALQGRRGVEHEAIQVAVAIHRWKEEMTHGAGSHP